MYFMDPYLSRNLM